MYLKQWRRPRGYRSIIAHRIRGIYQVDIMDLRPLWNRIFDPALRSQYNILNYALVSVDVYSRYVFAVSIQSTQYSEIAQGMLFIVNRIGKPSNITADNQVINAIKQVPELNDVKKYASTPGEANKNAIVERMIRTIKDTILKILMNYDPLDIYNYYVSKGYNYTMTNAILFLACYIINHSVNRTIKARPIDVFNHYEKNKQRIRYGSYLVYRMYSIVLKIPERAGQVPLKTFNYDPEPYIIVLVSGKKYIIQKLIEWIRGIHYLDVRSSTKNKSYKPYELRPFNRAEDFIKYLKTPLVRYTLVNNPEYGIQGYQQLLRWIEEHKDDYNRIMV
jgi:hypothetical protein